MLTCFPLCIITFYYMWLLKCVDLALFHKISTQLLLGTNLSFPPKKAVSTLGTTHYSVSLFNVN